MSGKDTMARYLLCIVSIGECTQPLKLLTDSNDLMKTIKQQRNMAELRFLNVSLWPDRKQ